MRKVYNPIGFSKGYNFVLFVIFAGAMIGFCLARGMFFNFNGIFCSAVAKGTNHGVPGDCFAYHSRLVYQVGIQMHLYTILPGAFLAVFQFVPIIRYKVILFHRINGYLVITLALFATTGALMIARVSFGGGIEIQVVVGLLAILFVSSLSLAYYNIKRLQIEQHRAWMLRAWFYVSLRTTYVVCLSPFNKASKTSDRLDRPHPSSLVDSSCSFLQASFPFPIWALTTSPCLAPNLALSTTMKLLCLDLTLSVINRKVGLSS